MDMIKEHTAGFYVMDTLAMESLVLSFLLASRKLKVTLVAYLFECTASSGMNILC